MDGAKAATSKLSAVIVSCSMDLSPNGFLVPKPLEGLDWMLRCAGMEFLKLVHLKTRYGVSYSIVMPNNKLKWYGELMANCYK